jgi:hypothetical protein
MMPVSSVLVVNHQGRGGSLPGAWWFTTRGVVVHYQGRGGSLPGGWWSTTRGVVVHYLEAGGQPPGAWWFAGGKVEVGHQGEVARSSVVRLAGVRSKLRRLRDRWRTGPVLVARRRAASGVSAEKK